MSFTNSTTTDSQSITRDAYDTLDTKPAPRRNIGQQSKSGKFSIQALDFSKHHDQPFLLRSIPTMIDYQVMAFMFTFPLP